MWREWAMRKVFMLKKKRFHYKTKRKSKLCFRPGMWVVLDVVHLDWNGVINVTMMLSFNLLYLDTGKSIQSHVSY